MNLTVHRWNSLFLNGEIEINFGFLSAITFPDNPHDRNAAQTEYELSLDCRFVFKDLGYAVESR